MASTTEIELKMYETYDAGYQVFLKHWQVNRHGSISVFEVAQTDNNPLR